MARRQAIALLLLAAFVAVKAQTGFVKSPEASQDIELVKSGDAPPVKTGDGAPAAAAAPTGPPLNVVEAMSGEDTNVEVAAALWKRAHSKGKCIYGKKMVDCKHDDDDDDESYHSK